MRQTMAAVCLVALVQGASANVAGVEPAKAGLYTPGPGNKFTCFDGESCRPGCFVLPRAGERPAKEDAPSVFRP